MAPNALLRLFCLPYAGGGASVYRGWGERLPREVAVHPVQLPGRETRMAEAPHRRMEPLVDALADALEPHLDAPFALFGHSMGSVVAFELARELRRRGAPSPAHLFVSGSRAPHLPDRRPPVHALAQDAFLAELRTLNGTPEELLRDPELMALCLPRLRADFEVCDSYRHRPEAPMDVPMTIFGGAADPDVNPEHLRAWGELTSAASAVHMLPGGHFFIEESAPAFLRLLTGRLAGVIRTLHTPR